MYIFILPFTVGTLYLLLQVLRTQGDTTWQVIAVIDVFLMNFGIFWLYDFLVKTVSEEYERVLLKKENQYFENQLLTMEKSITARKKLRHDLKNHFIVLNGMLDEENNLAAKKYLQDFMEERIIGSKEISTGNIVVDSILNYKILEAVQENVAFDLDIQIPEDLELPLHEMCAILGNAIDNALEAVRRTKEKRISVVMKYTKGRLCIQIKNAFEGKLNYRVSNVLQTKKEDRENHGLGLENIEDAVAGLNGVLDIDTSNQIFTLTVLLYLNH